MQDDENASIVYAEGKKKWSAKLLKQYKFGPFCVDGVDMMVIGTILALMLAYSIIQNYAAIIIVYGESMFPTFKEGEVYTTNPRFEDKDLTRNTVITFKSEKTNKKEYIKRIVALPGETIYIKDGYLYVNDEKQETEFFEMKEAGILSSPLVLGKDEYFVLGDNRNNSNDSRYIGPVQRNEIKGVVEKKLFKLPL